MSALLLLAALQAVTPAAGSAAADAPVETRTDASGPALPATTGGAAPLTPAALVARQVQAVLQGATAPEGWEALATALPEFALSGSADLEATLQAARTADSLARAETRGPASRASFRLPFGLALPGRLPLPGPADVGAALAGLVALGVVVFAVRGSGSTRRRSPGRAARARRAATAAVPRPPSRVDLVRALAARGVPPQEIARRTGLGQDALGVVLGRRAT